MITELTALVSDATTSLLNRAEFPAGWTTCYQSLLRDSAIQYGGDVWPKRLFSILHYVSAHLCLRFQLSVARGVTFHQDVKHTLGVVQMETESFLWREACHSRHWTQSGSSRFEESELISLCFGPTSPVKKVATNTTFTGWRQAYLERISAVQPRLDSDDDWNKWLCLALHFAANYLEMYQQQEVDLENAEIVRDLPQECINIDLLSRHIENDRVLRLIRAYIYAADADRTSTGIPKVASNRPRTGWTISVKTATELLIQSSVAARCDDEGNQPA